MKHRYHLLCISVLAMAGCKKAGDPPHAPQPQIDYSAQVAADEAAAEERAARAHLTESMTDGQILRAIGVDPGSVKLKPAPEGYGGGGFIKTAYTNETMDIEISRVPSTGQILVYDLTGTRWLMKGKSP